MLESHIFKLDECRSRRFAGSTTCWGGMCSPLTDIDIRQRSWVLYTGWPLAAGELEPYLQRAHALCGVSPYGYDGNVWKVLGVDALPFDKRLLWSHFWQINDRNGSRQLRFARKFNADLKDAVDVRVYLHGNVTNLLLDSSGREIKSAEIKTMDGRQNQVRAKHFVLACGGIENARLLLAANSQRPDGIRNQCDLVGRFFMEHLEVPCATVIPGYDSGLKRYSRLWKLGRGHAFPGLTLSPEAQERYQTLNASVSVDRVFDDEYLWTLVKELHETLRAGLVTKRMLEDRKRSIFPSVRSDTCLSCVG